MIQNAAARLVFTEPKRAHVTPLFVSLHSLQLQLASSSKHWCLHIEPQAQHPPTSTHYYEFTSPPEVWDPLVSDASWYHHREAQNHSPEHSRSPFLAGGMIFPPPSGILDPCQSSSNNWKLISFNTTWQCLRLCVTSTSSVCLPLQDESLYVSPNCKSLWIKASAKWLNANVMNMKLSSHGFLFHRNINTRENKAQIPLIIHHNEKKQIKYFWCAAKDNWASQMGSDFKKRARVVTINFFHHQSNN